VRKDVRAKVEAGYLLEAMRRACLAIVGAMFDMLVMVGEVVTHNSVEASIFPMTEAEPEAKAEAD
jgi:hypothetical protein